MALKLDVLRGEGISLNKAWKIYGMCVGMYFGPYLLNQYVMMALGLQEMPVEATCGLGSGG